jgi:ankyrin repeat protein
VNAVETGGYTPLHQAVDQGDAEMVLLLLEMGARPDVRSDAGDTPLDLAWAKGHAAVVELLSRDGRVPG